jgi:curved DNA-binding protein CbpA
MNNAFEILGIAPRLAIEVDELRAAFREAGKTAHPDAGGLNEDFAMLREAFETLSSPSRRLRHWLELRGTPVEPRGAVNAELMDLFAEVGSATQRAESLVRKRGEAKSALGLAVLEREANACRQAVEQALALVENAIERETSRFPGMEKAAVVDSAAASETARNLAFLEKWRASLRSVFSRLV